MTKLEEKLIELGYTEIFPRYSRWAKYVNGYVVKAGIYGNKFQMFIALETSYLTEQYEIDDLQQAFNEMQKDLEVLKGVEND